VAFELVRRTGLGEAAYVQLVNTRGTPPVGSRDPRQCVNRFLAFCIPYVWIATPEKQRSGLSMHTSRRWRVPAQSVSPRLKHYHWLDFQMSLFDAYDTGAETACCIDMAGHLAEGPGFNIMAVFQGEVRTPDEGVLDGMTRRTTLELCELLGIPWRFATFTADAVRQDASELFITTTAGGIIPVTVLDGEHVGDGAPGPVTRRLSDAYWQKREAGWHGTRIAAHAAV
jgi:branched-chain amino acid aminotransferase